jgi:hypothetical protein
MILIFLAVSGFSQSATTYDAAGNFLAGWTAGSNPNGVWTYGWSVIAGGALTRYTAHGNIPGYAQFDAWTDPTNLVENTPVVYLNTGAAVSGISSGPLPSGALILHGGGTAASCGTALGCVSEVVWTAPGAGIYNLAATFTGRQTTMHGLVEIIQESGGVQTTLLSGPVTDQTSQSVTRQISVNTGDTITFAAAYNGTMTGGDTTQLAATLTAASNVVVLPQLAFGGGWYTALYFTNLNSTAVSFPVNFIGDDGNPLNVSVVGGSSTTVNLAPRGTANIQIPDSGSLVQGYVSANLPTGVTGYGVFRQSVAGVPDQEAVVPLSGATFTTNTLLFDDTSYVTGVAVVNLASVSNTITATAYGSQGNLIGTSSISLPPNGKTAAVLRNLSGLGAIAGAIGSVDFTTSIGNVAALGLRFNGAAFTSIPTSDR